GSGRATPPTGTSPRPASRGTPAGAWAGAGGVTHASPPTASGLGRGVGEPGEEAAFLARRRSRWRGRSRAGRRRRGGGRRSRGPCGTLLASPRRVGFEAELGGAEFVGFGVVVECD